MRTIILVLICLVTMSFTTGKPDFEAVKKTARENHQLILLNFSGSDWCGPCIRMKKEIFDSEVFSAMAQGSLLMVNADFPRNKKNQLDKAIKKENEALADKYNMAGVFPMTVLMDANGKVIKTWSGLPNETATQFATEVKQICDANK